MEALIADAIFCLFGAMVLGGALFIAFSKNIVRCAFALLFTFSGIMGLYVFLSADFLAIVQLLVYIGGILILFLFAIFLTKGITEVEASNEVMGRVPAFIVVAGLGVLLFMIYSQTAWPGAGKYFPESAENTTPIIGRALLGDFLLPFELISVMLLAVVIGAIVIARKEIKEAQESSGGES